MRSLSQDKKLEMFVVAFSNMAHSIQYAGNTKTEFHKKTGAYPYIPMGSGELYHYISSALRQLLMDRREFTPRGAERALGYGNIYDFTFLDAGCGPGLTLALARSIGFMNCIGLEIAPAMVRLAKVLNGGDGFKIVKTDIRTSRMYEKADVIYYYVPMFNVKAQNAFEEQVANTARPGTIVIVCGGGQVIYKRPDFERIEGGPLLRKKEK